VKERLAKELIGEREGRGRGKFNPVMEAVLSVFEDAACQRRRGPGETRRED
jgi:hypothetical protein